MKTFFIDLMGTGRGTSCSSQKRTTKVLSNKMCCFSHQHLATFSWLLQELCAVKECSERAMDLKQGGLDAGTIMHNRVNEKKNKETANVKELQVHNRDHKFA